MTRRPVREARRAILVVALAFVAAACSATQPAGGAAPTTLTVYAASSLEPALDRLSEAYERSNPRTSLTIATDSSAALEVKLEQGAPADLFLSADMSNPEKLADKGLVDGAVTPFAANVLTVIVPKENPGGVRTPADLAKPGLKVVAAADGVPVAKYATELVAKLAAEPGYPPDFIARYAANVASREDNVAAVVAKIELGEGDAAIVYATDAKASPKVAAIGVPANANVRATYGAAVLRAAGNAPAARAFLTWLAGPAGQAVLDSLGFLPPS